VPPTDTPKPHRPKPKPTKCDPATGACG
jgi:hypothetical protein